MMKNQPARRRAAHPLHWLVRDFSIAAAAFATLFTWIPKAHACGGCFAAQSDTSGSFVTSHRMAFSVSVERTVLWDQFSYTGNPEDFSWVLPVKDGAYVEEAESAFLEALDQVTAPTIYEPPANCFGGDDFEGGGCGCGLPGGGAAEMSAGGGYYDDYVPPVQVISEVTVGPYDTVILRSTDENALVNWLTDHDYVVQPDIVPIIDAYVSEGFDFLALRLSPGNGVDQMTPVRVVTPGGPPVLPLRMVAAGVGAKVQMTLFVFANTPMRIPDLMDARIEAGDVTWDYTTDTSDYDELVASRLAENNGHMHLTTYAKLNPFTAESPQPNGFGPVAFSTVSTAQSTNFDQLYFRLAGETGNLASVGESCAQAIRPYGSSLRVEGVCGNASCEEDPGSGPSGEGGAGGTGSEPPASESEEGDFACGGFTDIQTALVGHIPRSVWLTRLDMDLPRSALERDCALTAAESRDEIEPHQEAGKVRNHPCPDQAVALPPSRSSGPLQGLPAWSFAVLVMMAWILRKPRTQRQSYAEA